MNTSESSVQRQRQRLCDSRSVHALIRSWADMDDGGEQRKTIDCLVEGLDRERLSVRKLFPEELKDRSW